MKRFLFISIFLHALVLVLLFSWEIPLADRLLPRLVVEVSLIERIEGKAGEKQASGEKKPGKESLKKENIPEEKEVGATRRLARAQEELKAEEPKLEKIDPIRKETREEKLTPEEKTPQEPPVLTARREETPILKAELAPPADGSGEPREPVSALQGPFISASRGHGGTTFLASAGLEPGREGIPLGGGGKGTGAGQGGEGARFSSVPKSSGDGDSVIAEIMGRIEKAKRYPRMARKMGTEGQATVRFRIKTDGKVEGVELLESSGSEILDQASLETVQRAAPLPYKEGWLKVVIVFKIL
jgi:protein TonB